MWYFWTLMTVWSREALEVGVRELEAHPGCAFVSGHCRKITADGSVVAGWEQFRVRDDLYLELLRSCPVYVPAVMYRRSVFDTVGDFDTSYKAAEDYDLYYRILERFPIHCHDTLIAEIRRHDGEHDPRSHLDVEVQHGRTALAAQTRQGGRPLQGSLQSRGETLARLARRSCGQPGADAPPRGAVAARAHGNARVVTLLPPGDPPRGQSGCRAERVARRLRHQHRELETHRYKLQQLKKPSERAAQNGDEREPGSPSKWSAERSGATSSA